MDRLIRISLANVLLLTLPLASLVVSSHGHGRHDLLPASGEQSSCVCVATRAMPPSATDCGDTDEPDRRTCVICELARSLHATGLVSVPAVSVPVLVGSAPSVLVPRESAPFCIHPSSRSPPVETAPA